MTTYKDELKEEVRKLEKIVKEALPKNDSYEHPPASIPKTEKLSDHEFYEKMGYKKSGKPKKEEIDDTEYHRKTGPFTSSSGPFTSSSGPFTSNEKIIEKLDNLEKIITEMRKDGPFTSKKASKPKKEKVEPKKGPFSPKKEKVASKKGPFSSEENGSWW